MKIRPHCQTCTCYKAVGSGRGHDVGVLQFNKLSWVPQDFREVRWDEEVNTKMRVTRGTQTSLQDIMIPRQPSFLTVDMSTV